ncbi:unnamed protein product, partial [marine sediment metagenome]
VWHHADDKKNQGRQYRERADRRINQHIGDQG